MAGGRPTKFKPEYVEQAQRLCELGATDYELASFFKVDTVTIYRWRIENEEFCNAVIAGKDKCDERVVRSLYNRAVGYTFESEKIFNYQGEVVRAGTTEHIPPDVGAAMNWLKNRKPTEWRDKVEHEHTGRINVTLSSDEAGLG